MKYDITPLGIIYENMQYHTFYHVASSKNYAGIFHNGLIPNIGEFSQKGGEAEPFIYMFTSIEEAENGIMNWLGDEFEDEDVLNLWEINLPQDWPLEQDESDFEIRSAFPISPTMIKMIDANFGG